MQKPRYAQAYSIPLFWIIFLQSFCCSIFMEKLCPQFIILLFFLFSIEICVYIAKLICIDTKYVLNHIIFCYQIAENCMLPYGTNCLNTIFKS